MSGFGDSHILFLVIFNGRRVSEPSRITIKNYQEMLTGKWVAKSDIEKFSAAEKEIIDKIYITYVPAKDSTKLVDVLIPKDCLPALERLSSQRLRLMAGVLPSNKHLYLPYFPYQDGTRCSTCKNCSRKTRK